MKVMFNSCKNAVIEARIDKKKAGKNPTHEEIADAIEAFMDVGGMAVSLKDGPQPPRDRVNPTHSKNASAYEDFGVEM